MISPASYIAGPAAEVELDDETGLLIALLLGMYDVLREPTFAGAWGEATCLLLVPADHRACTAARAATLPSRRDLHP